MIRVAGVLFAAACSVAAAAFVPPTVPPFTRLLQLESPPLEGSDVFILQNLLARVPGQTRLSATGRFDAATAEAVKSFQQAAALPTSGVLDAETATTAIAKLSHDGYKDNGKTAGEQGYLYKVFVPVHRNRSIETTATLFGTHGEAMFNFTVRTHGIVWDGNNTWPSFNSSGWGLNQFGGSGNTPTGLCELDLNSPEDIPREFGPYPVNRATNGLEGNAKILLSNIRDGILIHTGEWGQYSPWKPPAPMPNSHGCIHTWPDNVYQIWQLLVTRLGVKVRPNTDGKLPYPYKSQGLLSVQLMD